MALPFYLAMTAAEMGGKCPLPPHLGYMACHFSPYGAGISNRPCQLPEGAMLILDDSAPIGGHDPILITRQLAELVKRHKCGCVLLDFQRPGMEETAVLAGEIACALPCPVGVSELYGKGLDCPVFLPPVPADVSLKTYLAPWQGRDIWLEAAMDGQVITVTPKGAKCAPLASWTDPGSGYLDEKLHCRCHMNIADDAAEFTLYRTREDVDALLEEAEGLGVKMAVGLWQEFGGK